MPVFEYRCKECGSTYDIYHKGKEISEDICCPSCTSRSYSKLISVPGIIAGKNLPAQCGSDACSEAGTCCGGECTRA